MRYLLHKQKRRLDVGARDLIRDYFEANVGKIVTTKQIQKIAMISEYARRIRELRDEEGMQIKSHIDRPDLKPGEYILETIKRMPFIERGISINLRNEILERNGYTCQRCGSGPGDPDSFNPGRKVRLHIDHIKPISQGGTDDKENLRVLCSICNHSKANIQPPSESARNIMARIRRASRSVRMEIYEMLKKSMEHLQ